MHGKAGNITGAWLQRPIKTISNINPEIMNYGDELFRFLPALFVNIENDLRQKSYPVFPGKSSGCACLAVCGMSPGMLSFNWSQYDRVRERRWFCRRRCQKPGAIFIPGLHLPATGLQQSIKGCDTKKPPIPAHSVCDTSTTYRLSFPVPGETPCSGPRRSPHSCADDEGPVLVAHPGLVHGRDDRSAHDETNKPGIYRPSPTLAIPERKEQGGEECRQCLTTPAAVRSTKRRSRRCALRWRFHIFVQLARGMFWRWSGAMLWTLVSLSSRTKPGPSRSRSGLLASGQRFSSREIPWVRMENTASLTRTVKR